jgi:hypothetical protein
MSATNRGSQRVAFDAYYTPKNTIENFLDHYSLDRMLDFLEPCAGSGNICSVIRSKYPEVHITANELNPIENTNLKNIANMVHNYDFVEYPRGIHVAPDVIMSNPPFSLAIPIIEKCFEIASTNTTIVMLLRTSILESKRRYDFWQKHPVNHLYVLSHRPSFNGNGTDNCSYSWFVWDGSENQSIHVI